MRILAALALILSAPLPLSFLTTFAASQKRALESNPDRSPKRLMRTSFLYPPVLVGECLD